MKKPITILIVFLCLIIFKRTEAQNKVYAYYMNDSMQVVPKEQATVVGKGSKRDSIFLVHFYKLADNRLFLIEMFRDSTLTVLHGNHISYHTNGKKAGSAIYRNNKLYSVYQTWDTLGRVKDSVMYSDDMPYYLVRYSYSKSGTQQAEYEFKKGHYKTPPDENSIVIAPDGNVLNYELWKKLRSTGRYTLQQDILSDNKYLLYKFSDEHYAKLIASSAKSAEGRAIKMGQDYEINEVDIIGNKLASKELKGKILVINYWFISCKPCQEEIPALNALVNEFKDLANVKFIGMGLDDKTSIEKFVKATPFNYQLVANGGVNAYKYGVTAYPTHIIVDTEGKVRFHATSSSHQLLSSMKKIINELLEKERTKS